MADPQELFTASEAAALLRYKASTLAVWRSNGEGPAYIKLGRTVRYCRRDLEEWLYGRPDVRRRIEATAECHVSKRKNAKRLRGRAAKARRERQLRTEPLCRDCRGDGLERRAEEVDHIVALADGGTDDESNLRSLCRSCHLRRTRERLSQIF